MKAIRQWWDRYWFGESSLTRLAIFRAILLMLALRGALTSWGILYRAVRGGAGLVLSQEWQAIYLFEMLGLGPPSPTVVLFLGVVFLVAFVAGILGWYTRASCAVVALLFFYINAARYGFSQPHHDQVALMFGLVALVLAPSAGRGRAAGAAMPIRLTQISVAIGYAAAGWSKLLVSGVGWLNGYSLQGVMLSKPAPLAEFASQSVAAAAALSILTMAAQATFPLCLFFPRLRWIYLPVMVGFHLSTWLTADTGTYINLWGTVLAAYVAWDRLDARRLRLAGLATVACVPLYLSMHTMPLVQVLALPLLIVALFRAGRRPAPGAAGGGGG